MLLRLKILVLLQISNKYKLKKIETNGRLMARIGLAVLLIIILSGVYYALGLILTNIIGLGREVEIFTFVLVLIQLFSIIACVMGLLDNLYVAKDNMILLAYPTNPNEVFISKLIVYYIYDLIKSFFFFLPLFIGFGLVFGLFSLLYILVSLLALVLLPLFPVLIAALLTMPLLYIKKLFQRFAALRLGFIGILLIALFVFIRYLMGFLPVPLRILAMYDIFIDLLKSIIAKVNGIALFYNNIGMLFYRIQPGINALIILVVLCGLILAVITISRPLYFKMASKSSEHANLKAHKGKNTAHRNLFMTFFKKEQILALRNFGEFINNYSFMVALPYVFYIMMSIFVSVDRNELGNILTVVFSLTITLLMASASNTASAMAITSEGSEFGLLKTAPGRTDKMAWAKIIFNLGFSTILIVVSYLLFIYFNPRADQTPSLMIMMIASILINIGLIFWSFQIDLLNPRLSEYASSGALAHQKNHADSIKIGFGWTILLSAIFSFFLLDKSTSITLNYTKILAISGLFFMVRLFLFSKYLKAYFKEIEF